MISHRIDYAGLTTPIGKLLLADTGNGLCAVIFPGPGGRADFQALDTCLRKRFGDFTLAGCTTGSRLPGALSYLIKYFENPAAAGLYQGRLDPGGTAFQQAVWSCIRDIRPGQSTNYGEIARHLGRTGAGRAVGAACGANPLPIIVPCHRVIGAGGSLTGFGGGLELKKHLLQLEGWQYREG
ncbi:MAG: methylated-DNA--[protein]-cysteine S-methyltransferase [Gemmatimonadota bacterium]|nr:methylated-DNA--[protein]-cysteine S-methyltransferase [Gemmatimonadota bacterium]